MKDQEKRGTFIHGIAASEHLDSSGERIKVDGVDISSLTRDGCFNYEHNSKEASSIVGKILEAKKILKRSDCDNDHQKYFWDKVKMPYIYVAGELFDAVGHKEAGEVAAMVRYDQQKPINKDAKKLINFSIEGSRVEKQGDVITKCIARKISITLTPCNKVCEAEELKIDPKEDKHPDSGDFSFIQDIMSKSDEPSCQVMKGEIPFLYKAEEPKEPKKPESSGIADQPKAPTIKPASISRPNAGFGAIKDKSPKPPASYGKVIIKGKKAPVSKKKLNKNKPINPKDPVLNHGKFPPRAMSDKKQKEYGDKIKQAQEKSKLSKYDSNVRKALTASCGLGSSPATKVQGAAVAKSMPKKSLKLPKFFNDHKDLIPKDHPDHEKALDHISREHREGNKIEARRLHDRYISGGGNLTLGKSELLIKGARRLDAYDIGGKLPALYGRNGFVENSRSPFNPEYADPSNKVLSEHKPDFVEMSIPKTESKAKPDVKKHHVEEIRRTMKQLGDKAFERFEKKEELVKFLAERLPNLSEKEITALAKAVAYTSEKKKEIVLRSLVEEND